MLACATLSLATCNQYPTSALFHPQSIAVFPISRLISKKRILIFIFAKKVDFPFSLCYTFNVNIVLTLTFFIIVCQTSWKRGVLRHFFAFYRQFWSVCVWKRLLRRTKRGSEMNFRNEYPRPQSQRARTVSLWRTRSRQPVAIVRLRRQRTENATCAPLPTN